MGASELDVTTSGDEAFGRASAALADAEAAMPGEIKKEVFQLAKRLANIAQRRVLEEPTHGDRHTGLRSDLSRGVTVVEDQLGARILTSVPQRSEAIIPRGLDGHGWRHPTFARPDSWVVQHGAFSWFMDSMQGGRVDGEGNLERMLQEVADRIAAST